MMRRSQIVLLALVALFACASAKTLFTRTHAPHPWAQRERADALHPVKFYVAMPQSNLDQLEAKFWAVSTPGSDEYRNFMTRKDIMDIVRPAESTRTAVLAYLTQFVTLEQVTDHGDAFEVRTVASVAEKALHTEMYVYHNRQTNHKIVRQFGHYGVPAHLDNHVTFVAGLSEFPVPRSTIRTAPNTVPANVPQTLNNIYGLPSSTTGNASQGVIEFEGQSYSPSDLSAFATKMALTIPALTSAHVVGPNDPSSEGTEAQLDIEYIAATGANVENWFWLMGGEAWLYGWSVAFFGAADVPDVVSVSYGWNEESQCQNGIGGAECSQLGVDSAGYVQRVNAEFMKVGLRGVSILVASGDSGANGRTDEGCSETHLNPSYPAASPYVTAVGATQLSNAQTGLSNPPPACTTGSLQCASSGTEVAVSYAQAHFASGGGFSNIAAMPDYQKTAVNAYLNSGVALPPSGYFNATSRGFPDIAALGSSIAIVASGFVEQVGGTSCSSPINAGIFAQLNKVAAAKDGKPLGFLNPLLYKMAADKPAAFNDVTVGDNKCTESGCGFSGSCKGFVCAAGWDPVTGLGSLNYPAIESYIQANL